MPRVSPLRGLLEQAEAEFAPYGAAAEGGVEVVQTFGELELEYAALRRHCVLMDQPQRTVLELRGPDRLDFLNRMITQELKGLDPFRVRRGFWLNKKGRIDADLRVIDLPNRTLLEVDALAGRRTQEGLARYIITEEVSISDMSERTSRMSLHGPTSLHLLMALAQFPAGAEASGPGFEELLRDRVSVIRLGEAEVVVYREDSAGEVGLELVVPSEHAVAVYQGLLEAGHDRSHAAGEGASPPTPHRWRTLASRVRLRPAGWHAYNIARIEAGTPLYNIDFGPESLPAETGVIGDRVSFTKGCYLGQEIVARMHSRGHSKQNLVGVRFESVKEGETGLARLPGAGTELRSAGGAEGAIGVVTSSTLSPMLGSAPIGFAAVRVSSAKPGAEVEATVEGVTVKGTIQAELAFWKRK